MCFAHTVASVSWWHDKMRTDGNSQQTGWGSNKLCFINWSGNCVASILVMIIRICRKRLSFSALTQIFMIWSYSVCGLCVDACDCLCTSGSVIGFDLHCNCLGSSSMSFWQYVKHNKTLGLNFLTSDLDIWICIFFSYTSTVTYLYFFIWK